MRVQMGYFENFKSANIILVSGDEDGLQRLAGVLRTLEDANARPLELHLLPFAEVHGDVELTARPVDREMGVCRLGSARASIGTIRLRVGSNPPRRSRQSLGAAEATVISVRLRREMRSLWCRRANMTSLIVVGIERLLHHCHPRNRRDLNWN